MELSQADIDRVKAILARDDAQKAAVEQIRRRREVVANANAELLAEARRRADPASHTARVEWYGTDHENNEHHYVSHDMHPDDAETMAATLRAGSAREVVVLTRDIPA
jgi:hypothetical protein